MSWHVPNEEEIELVLEAFRDIVEPTLGMLEALLEDGTLPILLMHIVKLTSQKG